MNPTQSQVCGDRTALRMDAINTTLLSITGQSTQQLPTLSLVCDADRDLFSRQVTSSPFKSSAKIYLLLAKEKNKNKNNFETKQHLKMRIPVESGCLRKCSEVSLWLY